MGAFRHQVEQFHQATESLRTIVAADIEVTAPMLDMVGQYFHDVEIIFPIPVMGLDDTSRNELASEILDEMCQHFAGAVASCQELGDEEYYEAHFEALADVTNGLWRELIGVYAEVANATFEGASELRSEAASNLEALIEHVCEEVGLTREELTEQMTANPDFRANLRRLGLDPDAL